MNFYRANTTNAGDGHNRDFRRSNCLRQVFNPFYRIEASNPMNPAPPPLPNRPSKKPPYIFDYTTLSRIFRRKNLTKGLSIQQCASVLLPIAFSALLITVCVVVTLALLTEGFSLCRTPNGGKVEYLNAGNTSGLCLTPDCVKKAHFLLERLDRNISPCQNFYRFSCGHFHPEKGADDYSRFEFDLRSKLEQRPRPSFPLPSRLLFDFYDSCTIEEYQEQLGTQPFQAFLSRLGGWSLLQNAKFDPSTCDWETLEQQLHGHDIEGVFSIKVDPNTNVVTIKNPNFLMSIYQRQSLDEYLVKLLTELEVDDELALEAVQEALNLESTLIGTDSKQIQTTLEDLKKNYSKIQWDRFSFPLAELKGQQVKVVIQKDYLERVESHLGEERSINSYQMIRLLHSISAHLPRRYRVIRERFQNRFESRWKVCFEEMLQFMPIPLYGFALQQKQDAMNSQKIPYLILKSKEKVAKQLRSLPWMDSKTKERMLANLHNLKVITSALNGVQTEIQIRALYSSERLDPTSYFDNVIMLRQINSRLSYKSIHGDRDWTSTILNENPEIDQLKGELVYGPVSLSSFLQLPETIQSVQIRRHILEFLFHSDAITEWKPEPRSILKAKFHCFEKDLNGEGSDGLIYDQMALQSSENEEEGEEPEDNLKLPGLGDYSQRQLLYITFTTSKCDKIASSTPSANESERSVNHVLQNLDGFAEAFSCPIGSAMNPRDKCSIL